MPRKKWIVTAGSGRSLDALVKDLETAGLTIEDVHREIGVITGSTSGDTAETLRAVAGVADVSPDAPVDIGPPGSRDTW